MEGLQESYNELQDSHDTLMTEKARVEKESKSHLDELVKCKTDLTEFMAAKDPTPPSQRTFKPRPTMAPPRGAGA